MRKELNDITYDEFNQYEIVRKRGRYNMFDSNARKQTGLDRDTYFSILQNYTELCKLYPDVRTLE